MATKVIERTAHVVLTISDYGDIVKITCTFHPIVGAISTLRDDVVLIKSERRIVAQTVAIDWGTTGSTVFVDFVLSPEEFDSLLKTAMEIESLDGFRELLRQIIMLQEVLEGMITQIIKETINQLMRLETDVRILELVKNKDRLMAILANAVT